MTDQNELLARAARVLPGGLLGSHRSGPGLEFVVREGRGAYLYDMNGRRYLDYLLGSGPMLLGHAHPAVVDAVQRQMARGTSYFIVNEPAIRLAEEIVAAVPCAEQVRYTASGSEATFFALRVARAYRKRDKIMKFEGGFHGTHDYVLMSMVPRSRKALPAPMADSAGNPHAIDGEVLAAPYNALATTEALIDAHHDELAAVIVEPYQRTIPPAPGFLEGLRRATHRHGVPLVFDEIVTGFRFAYGGAQEFYKVVPDLAAFGKVVAGGFPLACIAGPAAIMRHFDAALEGTPDYVWQAGTFNGNAIAAAAGLATLAELRKPGTYERLFKTGARLKAGLQAAVIKHGVAAQVSGEPPVFDLFFTDRPVVDYRATLTADRAKITRFNQELLLRTWDPPHFDPFQTISYKTHIALSFTHSRLLKHKAGPSVVPGTFVIEGDLAESWSQPSETTYVFKLRKGVRWHHKPPVNGRELTADDVVYSVNHFLTVKGNANAYMLKSVAKVEATDKYTVKFTLKEPFVWFLDMLANPLAVAIVAREVVEKYGDLKKHEAVVGTGPWMLDAYRPNVGLSFVRNPGYVLAGLPYIDRVEMTVDEDNASRISAFLAGKYDLGWAVPGTINRTDWVQIKDTLKQ